MLNFRNVLEFRQSFVFRNDFYVEYDNFAMTMQKLLNALIEIHILTNSRISDQVLIELEKIYFKQQKKTRYFKVSILYFYFFASLTKALKLKTCLFC